MKRLILVFVSIFSIVFASQANIYTVTSNADANAGVGLTGDLRYCINQAAGSNVGLPHTIIFSTAMTVTLNTSLTLNADPELNGLTINGFVDGVAGPDVVIRSNNLCGIRGFDITGSITNLKFYGLVFQNVEYGIYFNASASATVNGSQIKGCYFGTDLAGTAIQNGICKSGIYLSGASSVVIGGMNTNLPNGLTINANNPERCVFGGTCLGANAGDNGRYGAIQLQKASNNVSIINNYIGVNVAGTVVLPIGNTTNKKPVTQNGITIDDDPSFNTIISNNVISGAIGSGISIFTNSASNGHVITGNIIGLDATGTLGYNVTAPASSFSNQASGIYISNGSNITIGGSSAATRNIISANGGAAHTWPNVSCFTGWNDYNQIAIYLEWCVSVKISGNYIGTDITGASSGIGTNNILGNRSGGIKIVGGSTGANNNIIGGSNAGEGNIISGNGYLWGTFAAAPCAGSGVLSNISTGHGIVLQYADCKNTSVLGNYIGLAADGISALGNNNSGIDVQGATNTTIGGTTAGARNYICANQFGITLQEDFLNHNTAQNTIVAGNYIGLNKNSLAVGNGVSASLTEGAGIIIQKGANTNTIGLAIAGGGNVISGNRTGIIFRNDEEVGSNTGPSRINTVQNNIIGLDPTGTIAIPNTSATAAYGYGIQIEIGPKGTAIPYGNIIGGTAANQANTISANQKSGIYIASTTVVTASTANSIVGNKIGTNAAGTGDLGNPLQGIEIINVNKTTITSNIISGNDQNGISLTGSTTNTIESNTIRTNSVNGILLTGSSANTIQGNTISSNTSNGISLAAASANNIIGGIVAGQPNTINTNGANGVLVSGATSINNSIHENSFSCNTLRGIVLSNGGNNNILTATVAGTPAQITYTNPNAFATRIEIFETDGCATCPANGTRLQGKTFVTSGNVAAGGTFAFTTALTFDPAKSYTAILHQGTNITTTAARNTSEFTACYTLCQDPTSVTITGAPLTFCAGGSVTLTANVVGAIGTPTYVWRKDGVVIGGNTATLVATASGSYVVEYSSTSTCSTTTSAAVTVTVNTRPTLTSPATATICSGDAQNYTITSSIPATYSWSRAGVTGISNAAVTSSSANPITEALINTTTSAINVVYSITATSTTGACTNITPFTYTVTVNPEATVPPQAPAAICSGNPFSVTPTGVPTGTTYTWAAPVITGSVSGATAQATAQTTISQTLTNNGLTAATVVYTVTPKSGACTGPTFTVTVTVNPRADVTDKVPAAICSGTAFSVTPTPVPAGTTYTWGAPVITGSVSGAIAQATPQTSISQTLINNGLTAATVVYTITPKSGACDGATFTVTVTVNPAADVTDKAPAAICSGTAFSVTPSPVPAGTTYTWGAPVITGSVSGATAQATAQTSISQTLINNGVTAATVVYTVTPKSGTCDGATFKVTVTVNPAADVTDKAPAAICSGTAFNVTPSPVPTGTTYTWGAPVITGVVSGATAQAIAQTSISQTLINNGLTAATVVYTITPKSGTCDGATFKVTVTVNPAADVTDKALAAICSGTAFSVTPSPVPTGTTYTWGAPVITGSVSGATAQTTAQTSISQTLINNGVTDATVVYTVTPKSGTCDGATFKVTVTVNPAADVTDKAPAAICSGTAFSVTPSPVPAGTTYTWGAPVITGSVSGASAQATPQTSISQTLTNNGLTAATVVYTVTPKSGTCDAATFKVTVTVNPDSKVISLATGSVCSGVAQNYLIASNVPSSFTWTRAVVIGIDNTAGAGASNPITETLTNSTNAAIDVKYIITPTSITGTCPGTAFTYTVKVNPKPVVTITTSGPTAFCSNGSVDLTASVTGSTGGTFEWFSGGISLGNANPLTVSTAGSYSVTYTSTSTCVSDPSASISTTINPDNSLADAGIDFSTCIGAATLTGNVPLNGTGSWSVVLPSTAVVTPGATSNVADATFLIDGNIYKFVYTVSGACGAVQTDTVEVAAGLTGFVVTASGPEDTLCALTGRNLHASASGGSGDYSYIWTSSDGSFSYVGSGPNVTVKPLGGETTYTVHVIDNINTGCKTNDATVKINAVESQDLNIPNLITPNGDNKNDIFILKDKVTGMDIIKDGSHIEVVNRWGSKVFEANNYENNWIPNDLTDGMYYYHITSSCGNKEYKSWLQILGNTNN